MVTRSTEEAMELHERVHGGLVDMGCQIAVSIARREGIVHSRKVLLEMGAQGLLDPDRGQTWIGAVFRRGDFVWTGQWYTHSDHERNIHERTVKIWKLREEDTMGRSENTFSLRDSVGTPREIIEPIVDILGPIGLDPCSHPGSIVPAAVRYYLPEYAPPGFPHGEPVVMPATGPSPAHIAVVGDGLVLPWGPKRGLVYVNPPYSRLSSEPWFLRALGREAAANVRELSAKGERRRDAATSAEPDEVVWLLPVRTAGSWWQYDLVHTADMITFLDFRVQHVGEKDPSPFHQALAYRGPRAKHWQVQASAKLGWTIPPREALPMESMGR